MKRAIKIILTAALCVSILMGLIVSANGSAASIYLMAVNDRPMEMTAENMPMWAGGALYVPYTMLSSRVTTINLGVSAQYNSTRRTVLVSSGQQGVVFDLQANSAYDIQNNPLDVHAVVRNSMVFLPIGWICGYFGNINYSLTPTPYGTLVRVTNSAVVLTDQEYVGAASSQLADNYNRYLASIQPPATPAPTPRPTAAPSVPTPVPTPAATPTPAPSEPLPGENAEVSLAYRWGNHGAEVAESLENANLRALFLFSPDELPDNDDAVRRLIAVGHTVGLTLSGETAEDCLTQAEEGSALLAAIARYPLMVVEAPALDESGQDALRQAGYILWVTQVDAGYYGSASAVMRALSTRSANLVELTCDEAGLSLSQYLWNSMTTAKCTVRQAVPPLLASLTG